MKFFKDIIQLYKEFSKLIETVILSSLEISTIDGRDAKKLVNDFFGKVPHLISFPCIIINSFSIFCFVVGGKVFGVFCLLCSLLILTWWYQHRDTMKQKLFREAKERYINMESLFQSAHIDMDIFYKMFPDWTFALTEYFTLHACNAFSRVAPEFEKKRSYTKTNYTEISERMKAMQVFGLSSLSGVTKDSLKKMYRKLAKKYHPDDHPGDVICEQKFKELSLAYTTLSECI